MSRKRRRLYVAGVAMLALGAATALVLAAFEDNLVFFYSPRDLDSKQITPDRRFRLGGLVADGTVEVNGQVARFVVTDLDAEVPVLFTGILPDLFREGQGVVAEGKLGSDGVFVADEVLAKHDENYMPPEVADALKESGRWNEGGADHVNADGALTDPVSGQVLNGATQ
ncbi:cytochrome c maturation protein CcmE [Roseospirillum parvum]|nr:cytochrome c maturation protein CcmE [Roseospirillum parvum]